MTTKLLLGLCTLIFICTGCEKDKAQDEEQPKEKIYASTLTGMSGKRWRLGSITLDYYNAGGGVDSTKTQEPNSINYQYQTLYFMRDGNKLIFNAENLLTSVIPANGSWQLNEAAQKIIFTCIESRFSPCNGTDGEWRITDYRMISDNPLREIVGFERTIAQSNGRKVIQRFTILTV